MNCWETIYKISWLALAVLSAICVVCLFLPKVRLHRDLQAKKVEIEQEVRRVEAGIKDLKDKQERFNSDPAFVEEVARGIGMVKTNEIRIEFTNAQPKAFRTLN